MVINPYLQDESKEFNPTDLVNLIRACVQELESRRVHALPLPDPFDGSGVFALYYDGNHPLYQHPAIRSSDQTQPIFVGRSRLTKSSGVQPLFDKLQQHARSIEDAKNLRIEDFTCRFLVLHPLWVPVVEKLLIARYDTLWNGVLTGFDIPES